MIFVTVGTQLPFDRLIEAVDTVALKLTEPVIAQIGRGAYQPKNIEWRTFITPIEFDRLMVETSIVVSHAGIGSVLAARRCRKPIVLFPRRVALGEHRNDHQLATIEYLDRVAGIHVARTINDLHAALLRSGLSRSLPSEDASPERDALVRFLRDYIHRPD